MTASVHLAWGRRGAHEAAGRGDRIVVVDVLRFSSAATTAARHGAAIRPQPWSQDRRVGSLSPLKYLDAAPGSVFDVSSPNGAMCCQVGGDLLVGSLLNATATARAVSGNTTVVACGERWPDDSLRVALEDYLGAGAILSRLDGGFALTADATVCARAFTAAGSDLGNLVKDCFSGRELVEMQRAADLEHCIRLDLYDVVVRLRDGVLAA